MWLWFGGMIVFSNALHRLGLMGMPRRTMIGASPYLQPEWKAVLPPEFATYAEGAAPPYGPTLVRLIASTPLDAPGLRVW